MPQLDNTFGRLAVVACFSERKDCSQPCVTVWFTSDFYATILKYSRNTFSTENVSMRAHILIIGISLILLFLIPLRTVYGQNLVEYVIQIGNDGSAAWTVRQTGTNINSSIDIFLGFKNRVMTLVEAARSKTQRAMAADENEFSFTYNSSGSYATVEYKFYWQNFSKIENESIIIGDVFQVEGFFAQLYGDGQVIMTYPSGYIVQKASPPPYERDDSIYTLRWLGTKDFVNGSTVIELEKQLPASGFWESIQQSAIIIGSLTVLAATSLMGFYVFRHRKKKETKTEKELANPVFPQSESDEEKVVKLLKSSGNGLYQSAIAEQCRFSKAKTSQLLAALENKGLVKRQKRGRKKIVVLLEQD